MSITLVDSSDITSQQVVVDLWLTEAERENFSHVQIQSSKDPQGLYRTLTSFSYEPAAIPSSASESMEVALSYDALLPDLTNTTLRLKVNGQFVFEYTFESPAPSTWGEVVTALNSSAMRRFLYATLIVDVGLAFFTRMVGLTASLEVLDCSAARLLGLDVGDIGIGKTAEPPAVASQRFIDPQGTRPSYYRYRLINRLTRSVSEWSQPIFASVSRAFLPSEYLVVGHLTMVDLTGRLLKGEEIHLSVTHPATDTLPTSQSPVLGSKGYRLLTDDRGYVETTLVRGAEVDVIVGSTNIVRTVSVPTDPSITHFNLLDPAYGVDDAFTVARPQLEFAAKRSLLWPLTRKSRSTPTTRLDCRSLFRV